MLDPGFGFVCLLASNLSHGFPLKPTNWDQLARQMFMCSSILIRPVQLYSHISVKAILL